MGKILTPEMMQKRIKTNNKILKYFILPIAILFIIIFIIPETPKPVIQEKKVNIDSIVALIKADKLFEIKDVYYNDKDSSINIAFTNKGNVLKDKDYSTVYFNQTYRLNDYSLIDGVTLYAYKKGKTLKNGDYKEYLMSDSKRNGRFVYRFREEFCLGDRECTALTSHLKRQLNDPDSYSSEHITVEYAGNNRVRVTNTYRAKNGFGALTLSECQCDFDMAGNGYNFKFN